MKDGIYCIYILGLICRIYVADTDNNYIQVFHCDDTFFAY